MVFNLIYTARHLFSANRIFVVEAVLHWALAKCIMCLCSHLYHWQAR